MTGPPRLMRNAWLALALMALAAWTSHAITPQVSLVSQIGTLTLEDSVPKTFADWRLEPALSARVVNPQQQAFVEQIYSQTLSRAYVNSSGQRVMVSVAYSEDQRRQSALHYPEICYPAQGFSLKSQKKVALDLPQGRLRMRRLETVMGSQRYEPLSYWVVLGEQGVDGGIDKKLALVRYGVRGLIADGLIFRVSSIGRESEREFALQDGFIRDMVAAMTPAQRLRLTGLAS